MEKQRFMFIPWNRRKGRAGDFYSGQVRLNWEEKTGKEYTIVYHDDRDGDIFRFDGEDTSKITIYTRGHGLPGEDNIDNGAGREISSQQLCDRLTQKGLQTSFAGKIKFYHCHSGDGGDDAFACRCASYLRNMGFKNASYFGYRGSVPGSYSEQNGSVHRWISWAAVIGSRQAANYPTSQATIIENMLINSNKHRASGNRVQV